MANFLLILKVPKKLKFNFNKSSFIIMNKMLMIHFIHYKTDYKIKKVKVPQFKELHRPTQSL